MSIRGHLQSSMGDRLSLSNQGVSNELDQQIHCMQDPNRLDDEKIKAAQQFWDKLEVYAGNAQHFHGMEKFMKAMLNQLTDTVPQFIVENSTQKLRLKCLELILRMACHDSMKNVVKDISKVMLRLIQVDNETNAVLGLKILADVWKLNKIYFMTEISAAVNFLKNIVKEMSSHVNNGLFDAPDLTRVPHHMPLDDGLIDQYLNNCFHIQPIAVTSMRGDVRTEYSLIPRSSVSLKVIHELSMFFVFIYQHHKQNMMSDVMEFLVLSLEFIGIHLPSNYKDYMGLARDILEDFHTAQTKLLGFLTIMGKIPQFMEVLLKNATNLLNSILTMLETLDDRGVATRKEILAALKFCFTSDIKKEVVNFLPRLLDESCILGEGFTSHDNLRVFLYQILADLLHHIRFQLNFPLMLQASAVFCREMSDPSLSFQTQVMCVRLLCSICEALPKMEQQGEASRDVLWQTLDHLQYKLERIASHHLPLLVKQHGLEDANGRRITNHELLNQDRPPSGDRHSLRKESRDCGLRVSRDPSIPEEEKKDVPKDEGLPEVQKKSSRHTKPDQMLSELSAIHSPAMSIHEARNFVKYLLMTVKICCTNIGTSSRSNLSYPIDKERDIMENILKYGLVCMDVFMLPNTKNQPVPAGQRGKEEKEALDTFAHVFVCMDTDVFKEIFAKHICMIIERINSNSTVQLFANAFLVRSDFVCKFGGIMIRYLMDNMDKLAVSNERTALYVKLFKIIFSAIGCGQHITTEGEIMLKPYLPDLIRKATEYALTAKEPLNYFLLLRALFRSIGGGAHDILYGQFLPLLPNLLQFLNKLQSCNHRLQMRELFLELCLTVPVRLSSLLPYLPLLMDPLVCALNGSTSLVQQGLRTLELCVDNLQPEYLFEHMAPVRSALIQGLWRVLSTSADMSSAQTAFRVLGKFGGANRRILSTPQTLNYVRDKDQDQACMTMEFPRSHPDLPPMRGELSLSELMQTAVEQMGNLCYRIPRMMMIQPESTGNITSLLPTSYSQQHPIHFQLVKESCMALARGILASSFCPDPQYNRDDWRQNVIANLKEAMKRLDTAQPNSMLFKGSNHQERKMYVNALIVIMVGVIQKDLRPIYFNFYMGVLRQLTLNALLESITPAEMLGNIFQRPNCLDGSILVDSLVEVLSDTNKDFLNSAIFALSQFNDTCEVCIPDKSRWIQFPVIQYLVESICNLCYGPAWFARLGGANGLFFVIKNYPVELLRGYVRHIVESLCEVIVGLTDEISSGAIDMAVGALTILHKRIFANYNMAEDPANYLSVITRIYTPLLFHNTQYVRDRTWELFNTLKDLNAPPLPELLKSCQNWIAYHKERITTSLGCMTMIEQESSLAAFNKILENVPEVIELSFDDAKLKIFYDAVFDLCETDVHSLLGRPCYKAMETCPGHFLPPYPKSTQVEKLKAMAIKSVIISYKVLCMDKEGEDERRTAFAKKALALAVQSALFGPERIQVCATGALAKCRPLPMEILMEVAGSVIESFDEVEAGINVDNVVKMEKLIEFNPKLWNKDLANKFIGLIQSWQISAEDGFLSRSLEDIRAIQSVMRLVLKGEVLDFDTVLKLVNFLAFFELNYTTDTNFGFLESVCGLISYYPDQILRYFCSKQFLSSYVSFFCRILEHAKGAPLRHLLKDDPVYFEKLLHLNTLENGEWKKNIATNLEDCSEYEESIVKIVDTVAVKEPEWFESNHLLIDQMRQIWTSEEFKIRYNVSPKYSIDGDKRLVRVSLFPVSRLTVPHIYGRNFVRYLKKNPDNLDLLFDLMQALDGTFGSDFGYLRDFLETDIIPVRSIAWRLKVFEALLDRLEKEPEKYVKNTLTSRIIQYLVYPCLQYVFERYNFEEVLGPGLPLEQEPYDPDHVMTRFTNVLKAHRSEFIDPNIIAMYQLCSLLVEFAPTHIHNNECKIQGMRLRIFMVFVWNTLNSGPFNSLLDPTVRFTGYLFLAHLIEKFTISRKIVLQVYNTLLTQYQLDNRDLIRKAIDVITPAVPIRVVEDGYQQLLTHVKKILMEESHNMPQIQHVVQAVCRNYKVYYNIRNDLISPLLVSVQRCLHCVTGAVEGITGRRLSLEVCEMAIKWELHRLRYEETNQPNRPVDDVDAYLETLKNLDRSTDSVQEVAEDVKREPRQPVIATEHVDAIINILLKFACNLQIQAHSNPNAPQVYVNTTLELGRKALGLLRAALKPNVWGEVTSIKYPWLEKQLTIPNEFVNSRPESQQIYNQHVGQAQQTLEVILQLAQSMNRRLFFSVLKPLQRPLISCMMQSYAGVQGHSLIKTMNYLLSKVFEKGKGANVVEELESLGQYLHKYLNEHFTNYYKNQGGMVQQVFTPFSVLRAICAHQPEYLDATCLPSFLKTMEKVVREQVGSHPLPDQSREKTTVDFLNVSLELLRSRVPFMGLEHRRNLCQMILLPLIDKTHYDKILECLIKMTYEILITHTDRNSTNPGLPLAVRLHAQVERRLQRVQKDPHTHPLMTPYLAMVLIIFENASFRMTEYAQKMSNSFYWGLTSPDPETRRKFMSVWERSQEPFVFNRLLFCLKDENWHNFRKYYWIRHVIWLLTQCTLQKPYGNLNPKRPVFFKDCSNLANTLEIIVNYARDQVPSLGATNMDCMGTNFSSPGTSQGFEHGEPMDTSSQQEDRADTILDKLANAQKNFLMDAMEYDSTTIVHSVFHMIFYMSDSKFTPKIFRRLYTSLHREMMPQERAEFDAALVPFLSSGVHRFQEMTPMSALSAWLEAVDASGEGHRLPSKLVQFISKNHYAWHRGVLIMEKNARLMSQGYKQYSRAEVRQFFKEAYGNNVHVPYKDSLDYLALMYKDMEELDPYAAIWDLRAIKPELLSVVNNLRRGEVKEAFRVTDATLQKLGEEMTDPEAVKQITPPVDCEINHLFEQYTICCEELLEWDKLREYANHSTVENPYLLMKAGMHLPDWALVRDCLDQLLGCIPAKYLSDYHMFQMMNMIMTSPRRDPNDLLNPLQASSHNQFKQKIDKFVDDTVNHHIHWWRGLPPVVSPAHCKILQAASMIREIADTIDLKVAIESSSPRDYNGEVLNQLKHIIKVWRNRICSSGDDMSYQSMVLDWRTQVHHMTLRRLEEWDHSGALLPHGTNSQNILPVHSAAREQMTVARAVKATRNFDLAIEQMHKLHTISAVPAMDAHTKICEHLKLIRQQAEHATDPQQRQTLYQLGLHLLNETDITYFAADQVSKIFTIRGQFLGGLDKREEAVKAFSYATQILMEKQPTIPPTSAFKAWGDQQDSVLSNDQTELAAITAGAGALACFLEVVRSVDSENRPRKYIGKMLWTAKQMAALGESAATRVNDIIDKNERTTVGYNWLPWIPQLINDVRGRANSTFVKILARICQDFPLQVFYHLRTALPWWVTHQVVTELCLKGEAANIDVMDDWVKALVPVMKQAIHLRPADCKTFHQLLSELYNMREFWAERQLRFALYVRNEIQRCLAQMPPNVLPNELALDDRAIGAVNVWRQELETTGHVSYLREDEIRFNATDYRYSPPEPIFIQEMSDEIRAFVSDCPCPVGLVVRYLESVIQICTKLQNRLLCLPKKMSLRHANPFLADFSNKMACIEMPKDLFNVQKTVGLGSKYTSSQYTSMLGRFDPFFAISLNSGEPVRKIFMRSINGKSCTYYLRRSVSKNIGNAECRKFFSLLNPLLAKDKEAARRFLQVNVMTQLECGYGCNLIEVSGGIIGENQLVGAKDPVIHPVDILTRRVRCIGMQPDDAVVMFYDRVFSSYNDLETKRQNDALCRQQFLMDYTGDHFIGCNNLLNYAMNSYSDPTQFYAFRKQVAKYAAVTNTLEYLLHLSQPTLQDIYITRSFGQYTAMNYTFNVNESWRPTAFRLTSNFYNFLGFAADGDMRWSMEATVSCMKYRSPDVYLRPLLWDFFSEITGEPSKEHVDRINAMLRRIKQRCEGLSARGEDGTDAVEQMMKEAGQQDKIALMDAALYPWF